MPRTRRLRLTVSAIHRRAPPFDIVAAPLAARSRSTAGRVGEFDRSGGVAARAGRHCRTYRCARPDPLRAVLPLIDGGCGIPAGDVNRSVLIDAGLPGSRKHRSVFDDYGDFVARTGPATSNCESVSSKDGPQSIDRPGAAGWGHGSGPPRC